jgi:four helix bundle protein
MVGIDARGKGLSNVENDLSVVRGQRHLGTMMPFERFKAWQVGHRLALDVYTASEGWPARERYGLVSQIRRAALSIPSNIAEGSAKRGHREFGRHLDIGLGSLSELTYLLRLCLDLKYVTVEQWVALEATRAEVGKLLWGLYRRVRPRRVARWST